MQLDEWRAVEVLLSVPKIVMLGITGHLLTAGSEMPGAAGTAPYWPMPL